MRLDESLDVPPYIPHDVETKWRKRWDRDGMYIAQDEAPDKPNWFALTMFPYPSGDVHIGHWYAYTPADAHARFMRMAGYNVMQPQGFDAFGLPAENAAIERGIHPREWTFRNIENMRRQFSVMGNSYDLSRELITCQPEYYKWNQFFFLKFMEAGLTYRARAAANWCPSCNTTLANEQVKDGACERCSAKVTRRDLMQWFFRITEYADELLNMDAIDWPENIKRMQHNWIGRSEGATIRFPLADNPEGDALETFTTRIDTIYGVTFVVLAPEHPLVEKVTTDQQRAAVDDYVKNARLFSDIERTATDRDKTGVFTGGYVINPATSEKVPIYIADYVLVTYGSGAIMGVPAHDVRDFAFAQKYSLPIKVVIKPPDWKGEALTNAYTGKGIQVGSGKFDGLNSDDAAERLLDTAETKGWGKRTVTYHLRDWLISRQRYWGTPIPIVYCKTCGTVPVPYEELPILLPENAEFLSNGESPLKRDRSFVEMRCYRCGGYAERETDTMDTFVDSAWYHLRYTSPKQTDKPFLPEKVNKWVPVHQYSGGAEHAVMHLMYARFFNKALRDTGFINFDEPYTRLFNQGQLIREHRRISKRSNPLNPEPLVKEYGADTLRCYLMFLGPWEHGGDWSGKGIRGVERWLRKVWKLAHLPYEQTGDLLDAADKELEHICHSTTKQVVHDMEHFKFNTAIASLMQLTNSLARFAEDASASPRVWSAAIERLLLHLAPLAPHIADELWEFRGYSGSIHLKATPKWDENIVISEKMAIVVQVNGKLRDKISVPTSAEESEVLAAALHSPGAQRHIVGREILRKLYVSGRLVSFVVK